MSQPKNPSPSPNLASLQPQHVLSVKQHPNGEGSNGEQRGTGLPGQRVEPSTAFAEWLNSGPDIAKAAGIEVEIVAITSEGGTLKLTSAGFPDEPALQTNVEWKR